MTEEPQSKQSLVQEPLKLAIYTVSTMLDVFGGPDDVTPEETATAMMRQEARKRLTFEDREWAHELTFILRRLENLKA